MGLRDYTFYSLARLQEQETIIIDFEGPKGQLISKCPFGVFKSPKNINEFFSRIFGPASKKRSNQKNSVRESK